LDNPLEFERIDERESRGSAVAVVGSIVIAKAGAIVVAKFGAIVVAIGTTGAGDGTTVAADFLATAVIPTHIFGGAAVVAVIAVAVIFVTVPLGRRARLDRATTRVQGN
jgi:hypothetical protein